MKDRRLIVPVVGAVLTLLVLFLYALPRQRQIVRLKLELEEMQMARSAVAKLLPEAAELAGSIPPDPTPSVPSWLNTHVMVGLEKRINKNDPYKAGQGAIIDLRNLKPAEVSKLLTDLTQVNLIVKNLTMSDVNARGLWDVAVQVEIPAGGSAAAPAATPTPGGAKP